MRILATCLFLTPAAAAAPEKADYTFLPIFGGKSLEGWQGVD
jgi:hypothetical protein